MGSDPQVQEIDQLLILERVAFRLKLQLHSLRVLQVQSLSLEALEVAPVSRSFICQLGLLRHLRDCLTISHCPATVPLRWGTDECTICHRGALNFSWEPGF